MSSLLGKLVHNHTFSITNGTPSRSTRFMVSSMIDTPRVSIGNLAQKRNPRFGFAFSSTFFFPFLSYFFFPRCFYTTTDLSNEGKMISLFLDSLLPPPVFFDFIWTLLFTPYLFCTHFHSRSLSLSFIKRAQLIQNMYLYVMIFHGWPHDLYTSI